MLAATRGERLASLVAELYGTRWALFTDLASDSLSALTLANLVREIFDVDVPVGPSSVPARCSTEANCSNARRHHTRRVRRINRNGGRLNKPIHRY